jgi:hypothetical protein
MKYDISRRKNGGNGLDKRLGRSRGDVIETWGAARGGWLMYHQEEALGSESGTPALRLAEREPLIYS